MIADRPTAHGSGPSSLGWASSGPPPGPPVRQAARPLPGSSRRDRTQLRGEVRGGATAFWRPAARRVERGSFAGVGCLATEFEALACRIGAGLSTAGSAWEAATEAALAAAGAAGTRRPRLPVPLTGAGGRVSCRRSPISPIGSRHGRTRSMNGRALSSLCAADLLIVWQTDNEARVRGGYVRLSTRGHTRARAGTRGHCRHASKARFAGQTWSRMPGRARKYHS